MITNFNTTSDRFQTREVPLAGAQPIKPKPFHNSTVWYNNKLVLIFTYVLKWLSKKEVTLGLIPIIKCINDKNVWHDF